MESLRPRLLAELTEPELPPFTPEVIGWVRWSIDQLPKDEPVLTATFYRLLFEIAPDTRAMFPEDMTPQTDRLFGALIAAAKSMDRPGVIEPHLRRWGVIHRRKHGVTDDLYIYVGQALVRTFNTLLTNDRSMVQSCWVAVYQWMAAVMIDGAQEAEQVDTDPSQILVEQQAGSEMDPEHMATVTTLRRRSASRTASRHRTAADG